MTVISSDSTVVVYDGAVTREDVDGWNSDLECLFARMGPVFYRTESRRHAEQYLRGLLAPIQRKNGWTIAEHVGEPEPKALQRFLNLSPWDVDRLLELNRDYVLETSGLTSGDSRRRPDRFRQEGHQIRRGPTAIFRNVWVGSTTARSPPSWRTSPRTAIGCCWTATVPAEGVLAGRSGTLRRGRRSGGHAFKTRPQQVSEMIDAASAAGRAVRLVHRRRRIRPEPRTPRAPADRRYQLCDGGAEEHHGHRHRRAGQIQLQHLATKLNHTAWQRRACGIGSKGFRVYDWALTPSADTDHEYMIRRSIDDGELAFYHCYNPSHAGFGELVNVAGARWPIEECFGAAKNEVGLDEYQVRKYDAWHRHITLAMLAHTFLAITAHHARKRGRTKTVKRPSTHRTTNQPDIKRHHQFTDDSSPSHSPKSADSSTFTVTKKRPAKIALALQWSHGGAPIRPTPAAATSAAAYAST